MPLPLPRLRTKLTDARETARVLRAALRHDVEIVQLARPPVTRGQHVLEVDTPAGVVELLAEIVGAATPDGHPLSIKPLSRAQAALLVTTVEKLDESADAPIRGRDVRGAQAPAQSDPPEGTFVDRESSPSSAPLDDFGVLESIVPACDSTSPPSSGREIEITGAQARALGSHNRPLSFEQPGLGPTPRTPASPKAPSPVLEAAPPPTEIIGRVIAGKYRIEREIGQGLTAAVYRAQHVGLGRPVAVKILHRQKLGEQQFVKRFEAEARSASKLEHPNITRVSDFGQESDGLLYIVMELLAGRTLESLIANEGRLAPQVALTFAIQACTALAFAHDEGIIHRDVKPENIMLVPHRDDDGKPCERVKVCDFGLAKLNAPVPGQAELTIGGMVCGSPAYMSPEQARGDTVDLRADVYALGVTLYECLSGTMPHEADTLPELFIKKLTGSPRPLSAALPGVDPLLENIVMRAVSTNPANRHPNARVLREELREVLASLAASSERHGSTIIAD